MSEEKQVPAGLKGVEFNNKNQRSFGDDITMTQRASAQTHLLLEKVVGPQSAVLLNTRTNDELTKDQERDVIDVAMGIQWLFRMAIIAIISGFIYLFIQAAVWMYIIGIFMTGLLVLSRVKEEEFNRFFLELVIEGNDEKK